MDLQVDGGPGAARRIIEKLQAWFRPASVRLSNLAGRKTRREVTIERLSAFVVIFTVVALIAGILAPGEITGVMLPLGLIMWFALYRISEQKH